MTKPRVRLQADGNLIGISDSLVNITANLGTGRDKASHTTYAAPMVDDYTLMNAYRGGWLPRKIVDIPPLDATRNWRNWQADGTEISAIEAEEDRHGIRLKVKSAFTSARLMGGAAILIGTGDTDLTKPLDPARIGLGGLKYATVIHKRHLYASEIENNPASPYFGKPAMWTLNPDGRAPVDIHASRLVILTGADVVDPGMASTVYGFGDSVLLAMFEAIRNMDATSANVASLVFEAKVDTVGIPDFMRKLGDPNYSAQMLKRWALAETGKGINGTFMHDAEEIIGQKTASFSGLPDLMDRFMTLVAGAADIPITRLLGQSPGGLNATGEADARNYYDRIRAMQELDLGPAMHILDECLIRSALGSRPDDVYYNWASLWQISDKERADIGKTQADTVVALFNTGIIDQDALADAAVNMLTESGAMQGLEGYVAQYAGNEGGEDEDAATVTDAAPRSLYVRRDVLNAAEIIRWAKAQGFKTTLPASDMHVTIAFSRDPVDWMACGESWTSPKLEIGAGGPRLMEQFGEARVLLFTNDDLKWRHERIKEAGASWDHPEYQPHITISYDPDAPDIATVEPYQGPIILGPEIFQEVKDNWQEGIKEK